MRRHCPRDARHLVNLASATATTLKGRLAKSCVTRGYFSGFFLARRNTEWVPTIRMRRRSNTRGDFVDATSYQLLIGNNPIEA
jgi:hypothetical protein